MGLRVAKGYLAGTYSFFSSWVMSGLSERLWNKLSKVFGQIAGIKFDKVLEW